MLWSSLIHNELQVDEKDLGGYFQAMADKSLPWSLSELEQIAGSIPTPFHLYHEPLIRENARRFYRAFSWVPGGFKNYYAVKALPNPYILQILKEEGMGMDCSSKAELLLSEAVGITGHDIMFTSNDTPAHEYQKAAELNSIINLDDISHLDYLDKALGGLPQTLCFRYNPGPLKEGNVIIGKPEEAKYGLTRPQIFEAYKMAKSRGVKRFGLHTMVASNELNPQYFVETAVLLFELAVDIQKQCGVSINFVNLGGGIGIPYRPHQEAVNLEQMSEGIYQAYQKIMVPNNLGHVQVVMENGRMVTGPYGWLVARALHKKDIYKQYLGLDACMANLMRPGMYGAYHHISVPARQGGPTKVYDVTGSLCENNDKFAIDREIPDPDLGDLVVIHDTGAHGHSMGFNYNGKLRSAEVLYQGPGQWKLIRRAESYTDLFATLDYPGLKQVVDKVH